MVNIAALIGSLFFFIIIVWFSLIILGILGFVLWILMIIDVAKRKFKQENDKVMWILIIALTGNCVPPPWYLSKTFSAFW